MSAAPDLRTGLSTAEAARRLAAEGPNEIARADGTPAWRMVLAQFASPLVLLRVLRDGHAIVVASSEVVRGDLLLLEAGDVVAADAQIVEAHVLATNEAALTGESLPVDKTTEPSPSDAPPGDDRARGRRVAHDDRRTRSLRAPCLRDLNSHAGTPAVTAATGWSHMLLPLWSTHVLQHGEAGMMSELIVAP